MKRFYIITIYILVHLTVNGQNPFKVVLDAAARGEQMPYLKKDDYAQLNNAQLNEIINYPVDTVQSLLETKVSLLGKICANSTNEAIVYRSAQNLILIVEDTSSLISDGALYRSLSLVPASVIDQNFRQIFNNRFSTDLVWQKDNRLIKLAGYYGNDQTKGALINIYSEEGNAQKIKWSALLAASRLNVTEATDKIIQIANINSLNSNVYHELVPDLLYTRNTKVYQWLFNQLKVAEKRCSYYRESGKVPIQCGYPLMEDMAAYIKDYPIEHDGNLILVNDYESALNELIIWADSVKDSFSIDRSIF
ncbi:hypothetical protein [Marinigracilibium pacificum]|uniref:Uncharacterized protein n=1 Tax=Marinigracilibium pacificum TaxID=2729599 RepID=A0A848J113_9BACT|nr:hypothetical protein [Marinigracilibium pacificum]NMM50483.1 hypothetical protein [Marinigracilibium pacificum]